MEESVDEALKIDEGTAEKLDNTATLEFSSVNQSKKRKRLWLVVSVIVVVVVLVVAGVWGVRSARIADCQKANKAYTTAYAAYEKAFKTATETGQVITSADQVADKAVFEKFHKVTASRVSKGALLDCDINVVNVFTTSTDALVKKTSELNTAAKTIVTVTRDLVASKDAKDLADAKNAAQAKLDEATNLYASSDGQVADNSARDNLQNTINAVNTALNDKKASVESLNKALEPVQGAIDGVNNSVEAKRQADAQVAAAQAQAQAQARSQTRSGSRSYSGGGSRSYSAPRSNSGNTGGTTSGASNFDWDAFVRNQPVGSCEAEGTCHLAIG
ncbi:hypothetical protein [Alloscardovia sp. HMSC034E08]|uniref:hypothetical protein n=1 Tax=Alloscardovia sp. HMSC034E08 TaxID=1739413 RepID=UPI0008AC6A79|nr:hypothetical protein [Alloscardovia sp. HMSC034E08]OFQ98287.1 hypothetical protein HMPREF2909_08235 [Alloscardovia sp. HMSC034E08]